MNDLIYFDCNCNVGRRSIQYPGSFFKTSDLVHYMGLYGIKSALVYHSIAREYSPAVGNAMLMEEIREYPLLKPVWVVLPHHTKEFPEPQKLMDQLTENGVRAVRMFPGTNEHNFSLSEWCCGGLLRTLEQNGVVLLIGLDQLSWDELYGLCQNHPALKIVLTEVNYRIDRNLYPLLAQCKNLFIETMGYKVNCGIEELCGAFGAGRLIFGSGMPVFSGASAVTMIRYSCLNIQEKQRIAHINLEELIGADSGDKLF